MSIRLQQEKVITSSAGSSNSSYRSMSGVERQIHQKWGYAWQYECMVEYVVWRQAYREIPTEDSAEFYDSPLPELTVFRYAAESFSLPSHRTHFSMKITLAGQEDYFFRRRRVRLNKGQVLFANDGEVHGSAVSESAESLSIFIPESEMRACYTSAMKSVEDVLDHSEKQQTCPEVAQVAFTMSAATETVCNDLLQTAETTQEQEALTDSVMLLVETALREVMRTAPPWALSKVRRRSVRDELISRVLRAKSIIDDKKGLAYNLDELADDAWLSKYHLLRAFRELVGDTPGAYARRIRLDSAHEALSRDQDLARVARRAGYRSVRRFKDAYIRQFGSLPV